MRRPKISEQNERYLRAIFGLKEERHGVMAEKLRFGIVGCGVIGPVHAEAISSLPDSQLVAVIDLVPEKAQKLVDHDAFRAKRYRRETNGDQSRGD